MKGGKLPFENWLDLYLLFLFLFEEFSLKFLHLNQIFSMYIRIYFIRNGLSRIELASLICNFPRKENSVCKN